MPEFQKIVQGQEFPAIYSSDPVPFQIGSTPSGAVSARATTSFTLNTQPGNLYGIRINNIYEIPNTPSADVVRLFDYFSRVTDLQQSVQVKLSQQNFTLIAPSHQAHISGTSFVYYALPAPFPVQGANNITVEIRRLTSYPSFLDGEVERVVQPQAMISVVGSIIQSGGPMPGNRRSP